MVKYKTHGTCSKSITFDVEDGVVTHCEFERGCHGNAVGLCRLVTGRKIDELIPLLKGIQCQNGTSCPDQLATALENWQEDQSK